MWTKDIQNQNQQTTTQQPMQTQPQYDMTKFKYISPDLKRKLDEQDWFIDLAENQEKLSAIFI